VAFLLRLHQQESQTGMNVITTFDGADTTHRF
jgi:hypothetical protein